MKNKYAIIVAGGQGIRMGTDIPKQFLLINGKPVLMHTLHAFYDFDPTIHIILVLPELQQDYWKSLCEQYKFNIPHDIVDGGATRFHSVKNGLKLVDPDSIVAIHDGVRPLVSKRIIYTAFNIVEDYRAVYPVIPITDTLRRKITTGSSKIVDRTKYYLVQTPQVFLARLIINAYETDYSDVFTDDISVLEARKGYRSTMIEGDHENIKITTPTDLIIAEALLKCRT